MENIKEQLLSGQCKLSLVGLGYVGMPIAVGFSKKVQVIGFDTNANKITLYQQGKDPTFEVGDATISACTVDFTCDETRLREAKFHIVAVPTPVNQDKTPDLSPVIGASTLLGRNLTRGSIVVYESTVYPGVTEEICAPILEKESGLVCGVDFKIGYSPERINPGDKVHRLENICKIVSGMDAGTLDQIAAVYELVIRAGVHKASSIKVAEAAKVVENSQRDINIAFMNELAMVFDRMGIDTREVIAAMNTKWNALDFTPGLVGGHCIGVDPYYFVYQAEKLGYHSQIILSGRKINDCMGAFVADAAIREMVLAGKAVRDAKVVILGITFKENCPDIRNSKVKDILDRLREYGVTPIVVDPWAERQSVAEEYAVELVTMAEAKNADCVILAVAHQEFRQMEQGELMKLFHEGSNATKVLVDVKGILDAYVLRSQGYRVWRL